jgi:transposase
MEANLASMPKAIARKIKLDAMAMMAEGMKQGEIAQSLRISKRTIQRAKAKQHNFGDIEGSTRKQGRKPTLSSGMEDVLSLLTILHIGPY